MVATYHKFLVPFGILFSKEIKVSLTRDMMAERERREREEREEREQSARELQQ